MQKHGAVRIRKALRRFSPNAGTGNRVRISCYELWQFDNAGLIAESKSHFDAAEYERQLKGASF